MRYIYLFIIICQISFPQNSISDGKIEYDMILTLDGVSKFDASVLFNSKYSLFEYAISKQEILYSEEIQGNGNYAITKTDTSSTYVFINKIKQTIYEIKKSLLTKEIVSVKENFPLMEWELIDEKKQIGSYVCLKAITTFRGRNYTAWYALELPYNVGPWKFNNLPGMILEVSDLENQVVFLLKSIKIPFKEDINDLTVNTKIISREQSLKDDQLFLDDLGSKITSKLSRDIKITIFNKKISSIER